MLAVLADLFGRTQDHDRQLNLIVACIGMSCRCSWANSGGKGTDQSNPASDGLAGPIEWSVLSTMQIELQLQSRVRCIGREIPYTS